MWEDYLFTQVSVDGSQLAVLWHFMVDWSVRVWFIYF